MKQNIAGEFVIFEDKVHKPCRFSSKWSKIFCRNNETKVLFICDIIHLYSIRPCIHVIKIYIMLCIYVIILYIM